VETQAEHLREFPADPEIRAAMRKRVVHLAAFLRRQQSFLPSRKHGEGDASIGWR
jgi:hypothetical protein